MITLAIAFAALQSNNSGIVYWPVNGHYYQRVSKLIDWQMAMVEASNQTYKGLRGHLATIGSVEENQFIFENLGGDSLRGHWLGGARIINSKGVGDWHWITGERFGFVNFGPGEPNNNQGHENALQFHFTGQFENGKWNDLPSNEKASDRALGYVVEFEPDIARSLTFRVHGI